MRAELHRSKLLILVNCKSTVVAFLLINQQPQVRFPAFPKTFLKKFLMSLGFIDNAASRKVDRGLKMSIEPSQNWRLVQKVVTEAKNRERHEPRQVEVAASRLQHRRLPPNRHWRLRNPLGWIRLWPLDLLLGHDAHSAERTLPVQLEQVVQEIWSVGGDLAEVRNGKPVKEMKNTLPKVHSSF